MGSISITDTVRYLQKAPIYQDLYYNLVVVYAEGKSDFCKVGPVIVILL